MATRVAALRVTVGGQRFLVRIGDKLTVGRDPASDAVIDDPRVSRHHLLIEEAPQGWTIRDLGSRNGTFVAGVRIESAPVEQGRVQAWLGGTDGIVLTAVLDGEPDEPPEEFAAPASAMPLAVPPRSVEVEPVHEEPVHEEPVRPPATTTEVPTPSPTIRIGRAPDNTIVLDDLLVSRYHAEVRLGPEAEVVDLGSANGTFLNGHKVGRAKVRTDDVIGIGQHTLRVTGNGIEEWAPPRDVRFAATGLSVRTPNGDLILDGIDLAVGSTGFLAVVGPSGTGKSTLLNALTGGRPADTGAVFYEGRNLYAEYDDLRSRIGVVPQDDVVHPQLTVRQALTYAAELRFPPEVSKAELRGRVSEVMEELRLSARADVRIKVLSGGQRKRVSVALELLTKPPLLFLDEPTSGLDPGLERDLMLLFRRLADEGRSVIVVTHSVASLYLCDNVLVVAPGGRLAFFGPPTAVPRYFGQQDFEGVFQQLTAEPDTDWAARYAASPERQNYLPSLALPETPSASAPAQLAPPKVRGNVAQFRTLTRRYLSLLWSDRATLIMLAAQAVLAGLLQFVVLPRGQLAPPAHGSLRIFSSAAAILLNPVQIATALGLANAVTQLVKERAVFRRERAVGLSIPAYLASKAVVLASVAIVQAVILVTLTTINEGGPTSALALGRPLIELSAVIGLTGIAAMSLGLLISALSPTEAMAMTILPIVLVIENVLSMGGLSPSSLAKPVLNQAQYVSSAQWGFSAAAATADLNHLEGLSSVLMDVRTVNQATITKLASGPIKIQGERRYRHLRTIWYEDMGALLALTVAALIGAGLALARGDPALLR